MKKSGAGDNDDDDDDGEGGEGGAAEVLAVQAACLLRGIFFPLSTAVMWSCWVSFFLCVFRVFVLVDGWVI
jgi:hypothetical protein